MALRDTSILFFSDDNELFEKYRKYYTPRCREIIVAHSTYEAIVRVQQKPVDVVFLKLSKSHFSQKDNFFNWCLLRSRFRKVPWIILGRGVEPEDLLIEHRHIKFVDKVDDFEMISKLMDGMLFAPTNPKQMVDVNFINPLVGAVVDVLDSMAGMKLERGQIYIKGRSDAAIKGDITGIIAMNSDRFSGSLAISFPERVMLAIYRKILGSEANGLSEDVKDCVMELTNIIYGNAKKDLNAIGHTLQQSVPSVITGPGHEVRHHVDGHCIGIPFHTEFGPIIVECVVGALKDVGMKSVA